MEKTEGLKVQYLREMRQNYLMIEASEFHDQGYETKMMIGNTIEGLLKFRIKKTDNQCKFCYEITSKQPLRRLLDVRCIRADQVRGLLFGIARTLARMEDYLLSEHQILLDPDFIYVNPEEFQPFLCLLPGKKGNFPEEFSRLLQFLLGKVDHQDKETVVLVYGLYQESLKENYGLDNLLRWMMKKQCPNMDYQEEYRECETIKSGKTNSWLTEPKNNDFVQTESRETKQETAAASETEEIKGQRENGTIIYYLLPGVLLISAAGGSWLLWGIRGFLRWGIWLAFTGSVSLAGGLVIFWRKRHRPKRNRASETVRNNDTEKEKTAVKGWKMMFEQQEAEERRSEEFRIPEKNDLEIQGSGDHHSNPAEDLQTMLLWKRESAKCSRYLMSEDGEHETIRLAYFPFIIGKQEGLCDCVIARNTVSRLHLRIDQTENGYQITDLNSTNGTYVNGHCLEANETVNVQPEDKIGIADLKFRFVVEQVS